MSRAARVAARAVVTPSGVLADHEVVIEDGVIVAVTPSTGPCDDVVVAPGFVDLQVNGIADVDVWSADGADWDRLDELLLAGGTTTWCPTLVTAPLYRYDGALARIAAAATRHGSRPTIGGAHLEGPFLGGRPGAHRPDWIIAPDADWLFARADQLALVTLAPESDDAIALIAGLAERDVLVALGHTDAGIARVEQATRAGARLATHLFNGMPPFHHRDPGTAGAVLTEDRLCAALIADLVHVHPRAIEVAFRAKPVGRVALVTDAVAWQSEAVLGNGISEVDGAARRSDGTLAGSTLRMDQAVANVVLHARVDVARAVRAASTTPADLLGLTDRGRIEPGARADLLALDPESFRTRHVWLGGERLD